MALMLASHDANSIKIAQLHFANQDNLNDVQCNLFFI